LSARAKAKVNKRPTSSVRGKITQLVVPRPAVDDGSDERQRGGGVQSLGRAFAILEEVARHRDGIGLADLSRIVGLHNSTTFHLAKTMVSLGYLRQEKETRRYRIGRPLFALAASALDEIEMVNLATPVLEDLSRETGEASHFAVRMGDTVVVVARTSGPGAFQLADRVGVVRPAHCTAVGKAILASLQPDQVKRFLERSGMKPSTPKSVTEVPALIREIDEVRRTGIAIDDGEFNLEVRCLAVPVEDFTGKIVGALGISGPIWTLSRQVLQGRAKIVQAAAARLAREFGAASDLRLAAADRRTAGRP
jgi:IclR family transcriptional regulator, KDG regulon repressor